MPLKKLFDPGYEAAREREALRAARIARQTQRGQVLAQSLGKAGAGAISGWSAGEQAEKKSKAAEAEKAWKLSEMQRTRARQDAADLRSRKGEARSAVSHHLKTNMAAYAAMPKGQRADAMVADVKQLGMNMDPRAAQALISKFESEQAAKGVTRESADLTLQKKQYELDSLYYKVSDPDRKVLDLVKMQPRGVPLPKPLRSKVTEILEKYGASSALSPGIQGQVDAATGKRTSPVDVALGQDATPPAAGTDVVSQAMETAGMMEKFAKKPPVKKPPVKKPTGGPPGGATYINPKFDLPPAGEMGRSMLSEGGRELSKSFDKYEPAPRRVIGEEELIPYGQTAVEPYGSRASMVEARAPAPTRDEPLPAGDELSPLMLRLVEIDPGVGEYIAGKPKEEAEVIEQLLRDGGSAVSDRNAVIFRDANGTVIGIEKIDPDAPSPHISPPAEEMPMGDFDPVYRPGESSETDLRLRRYLDQLGTNKLGTNSG